MSRLTSTRGVALYRAWFRIYFENLREHTRLMEDLLAQELASLQKRVEKTAKTMSQEEAEDFYDWNSDDHWKLSEVIPNMQRQSSLVTMYSFLESQLFGVCRYVGNAAESRVSLARLS